jgi:hypothetical protein
MDHNDPQAFLAAAMKAFQAETASAKAALEHAQSCRFCHRLSRWRLLNFVFQCRELRDLLFEHMTAQVDADVYRLEMLIQQGDDWLENLYNLDDKRGGTGI